jgi:hypothetical protein
VTVKELIDELSKHEPGWEVKILVKDEYGDLQYEDLYHVDIVRQPRTKAVYIG